MLRLEARIKSEVNRNNQFKSILEELRGCKHGKSLSKCAEIKYQMSNDKLYELNMILDNIIDEL